MKRQTQISNAALPLILFCLTCSQVQPAALASTVKLAQNSVDAAQPDTAPSSQPDLRIKPKENSDSQSIDEIAKDSINKEIKMLTTRITIKPEANALCRRAYLYATQGQPDLSQKDLERAVKLFPDSEDAVGMLAEDYITHNEVSKADAILVPFLRDHENSAAVWMELAKAQFLEKHLATSITSIDKAIAIDPKKLEYYFFKVSAYVTSKDYDQTVAAINEGLKALPNNETLLFSKAYADEALKKDPVSALKELNELVSLHPDFLKAIEERAGIENDAGDFKSAKADYDLLLDKISKREMKLGSDAADKVMKRKDVLAGMSEVAKSKPLLQLRAKCLDQRSYAELQLNQLDASYDDAKEACTREPKNSAYHHDYGSTCLSLGKTNEAEEQFKQELSLDPSQSNANFCLGYVYLSKNDYTDACSAFSKVIKTGTPSDVDYASIYNVLALKAGKKNSEAESALRNIPSSVNTSVWPGALVPFLRGQTNLESVKAIAKEPGQQTELHFALALKSLGDGDTANYQRELSWVKEHGVGNYMESAAARKLATETAGVHPSSN